MMPNITRGVRMKGLLEYLAGPGKANEHTSPHLVAGDGAIMTWYDDAVLDMNAARQVAVDVDAPRRLFEVEVPRGSVWHCSLSVREQEGIIDEAKWAGIARDFVEAMGFTESSGKAGCRWVAVHHGHSSQGNDHIHIAVSLVREDGTKASVWNDFTNAQRVAGQLEVKYGLEVLESRGAGLGDRGVKPAEQAKAKRLETPEPERFTVARTVRGCAAASGDEAEFVRRARGVGLLVRPRYAAGRQDVVLGYSAALRPAAGEAAVWFGGGHLARDLSLPRLRAEWPDTPQAAEAAAAEWNAARRGAGQVASGREAGEVDPALWERYTDEVAALRESLRSVPVDDVATWARVAHQGAGVLAAWSLRVEAVPGPLAAAADCLARSASVRAHQVRRVDPSLPSARGASLLVSAIAAGGKGTVAQAAMLRQISNTVVALHDAHQAMGQARRAAEISDGLRANLRAVRAGLPAIPTTTTPPSAAPTPATLSPLDQEAREALALVRAARAPRGPASVLPADLQRARHTPTTPTAGRDFGR